MPAKLVSPIVKLGKQKIITGTIVDVLGELCSVRLSNQGAVLHALTYIGPKPAQGDSVIVDYRSGKPIVHTNTGNLEEAVAEVQRVVTSSSSASIVVPGPSPETPPGVDAVRRFIMSAEPTVDDDETLGYEVTDVWYYNDAIYVLEDATEGAAVWVKFSSNLYMEVGADAGGDLDGTYPNPSVAKLLGKAIDPSMPALIADGNVLVWNEANAQFEAGEGGGAGGVPLTYEDLTSQIPAVDDHFVLAEEAVLPILLFFNTTLQSTDTFTVDVDNLGLTTSFSPVAGDKLIAVYGLVGGSTEAQPASPASKIWMYQNFR